MHDDAYISGHSENNIKCVVHDDLGWKSQTTRYILPRHWLYEWFSQLHSCGTYSVLSGSHSYVLSFGCCCLSCQYLPSDWLERLLWGSLYTVRRLSPQSPGRRALITFGLLCFFIVSLCVCLTAYTIYFILLWRDTACLCWKCRWMPIKQPIVIRRLGLGSHFGSLAEL